MVCFGVGLSGVDVSSEGVLLDDAVYVIKLAAAFPIAKTQAACLQILIPLDQLNLAAGIDAAASCRYLYPICKKEPAIESGLHIAGGNEPAELLVIALLVGLDYSEVGGGFDCFR
jgi:hypothetical protein